MSSNAEKSGPSIDPMEALREQVQSVADVNRRLTSLSGLLLQLYAAGGVPLVVVGVGALNLLIPYDELPRLIVSTLAIVIGSALWIVSTIGALLRWRIQAQRVTEREGVILRAACDIALGQDSSAVTPKLESLTRVLKSLDLGGPSASGDPHP